uniref:Uncharacterized protein n=1 Tax=Oncorhynchus kisutch TaxID=8019 RepID=A0A8C7H8E6_ONCKI
MWLCLCYLPLKNVRGVPMTCVIFCSLTQCNILQVGANFLERVVWKFDGRDDALALKELISGAQRKGSCVGTKFQDDNRVRSVTIHQSSGASDVKLRVSLENLLAAEQVGRWWIVGLSWSRAPMIGDQDIRRNIFCVIITSEDYLDLRKIIVDEPWFRIHFIRVRFLLLSPSHETSLARVLWLSCKTAPLRVDHVKSLVSISAIVLCLVRISGIPKLGMLWEGLKLFISHFLLKIAQPQGPAEQTGLLSEQAEVTPEAKETKLKL